MTPDTTAHGEIDSQDTEREMIDEVHRRLVRIHAAIAERTNKEVGELAPWTLHELMSLIREVGAYRRERWRADDDVSRTDVNEQGRS